MRKILLISALTVGSVFANAQSFYEGFETGPTGWGTTVTFGNTPGGDAMAFDSGTWHAQNESAPLGGTSWFNNPTIWTPQYGTGHLCANYNSVLTLGQINNYMMSPVRTLNNGDVIRFYTRTVPSQFYPDRLHLKMSLAGSSTATSDFTTTLLTVNNDLVATDYPNTYTLYTVTLSGLSGPTSGRFAFNYDVPGGGASGSNSDFISIDGVVYAALGVEPPAPPPPAVPVFSQTISLGGSYDCWDAAGSTNNVFSAYTTTSSLVLSAQTVYTGVYTQVYTNDWASEACVRIRDNAQPTLFADLKPFLSGNVPSESVVSATKTMTGSLLGANIAASASLSLEFFESFDDVADLIDGNMSAISIDLYSIAPQVISGTLNLQDTGAFAYNRTIGYTIMQGTNSIGSGSVVASASATSFAIPLVNAYSGAATIVWDGSSFLKRNTGVTLTGSSQAVGAVNMQNGDVDASGEVDAADIDAVIADFGILADDPSDVDVSGEVDAADIDIVIANFGGLDD